ncbi:hypothetical protein [Flexivirga sp.]|uniref:hypothetical protein n=1 Tax=Flexivirga sp. TaxID=1962927 RepID=UPI003F7F8B8D
MEDALTSSTGAGVLAAAHIRAVTVLAVARVDARSADRRTGRNLSSAHATVAAAVGRSVSTVRRARSVIAELGYAVTITRGRYLTAAERAASRAVQGAAQIRAASLRALTLPREAFNTRPGREHLPRRGRPTGDLTSSIALPTRTAARGRNSTTTRHKPRRRPHRAAAPRPRGVQRMAARVAARQPWLARGHIGRLCDALTRLDLDPAWTARDLIDALDQHNRARGMYALPANSQRNPLALFITQVRSATANREPPAIQRATRLATQRIAQRQRDTRRAIDAAAATPPNAAYRAARKALGSRPRHRATPQRKDNSHDTHTR